LPSTQVAGTNGTVNTGGGGGGSSNYATTTVTGASGGSGIVIIKTNQPIGLVAGARGGYFIN
jgi:hypothetical protein